MESKKEKLIILLSIASFAALSIAVTAHYRSRRRKRNRLAASCYLHTESKPQSTFNRILADNSYSPFKHLNFNDESSISHPYETEIAALVENPPVEFNFLEENADMELRMDDSYVWVDTESKLTQLVDVLSKERVFGVDAEQHSLRSFLGFTALVQISTKNEDCLVDTIALHDSIGILRPVFADPNICKVFHGADGDVVWLQRDFHIYVVNLFDTAKACEVLSKPQKSLAYLLETYCSIEKNKSLQREDWRQRPLSEEMVQYARADARYLLYIANCLIAELKQLESEYSSCLDDEFHFVLEASRRSNSICLQLYAKDIEYPPGDSAASSILYRQLNGQAGHPVSDETKFQDLVRRLCAWRDLMARVHDESGRFVLSDQAMAALADKVPTTQEEIYSTIAEADLSVDPSLFPSPSPIICSHWDDVCHLMQDESSILESLDKTFPPILEKCIGAKGSCPLSVFNYALLLNSNLKPSARFVPKQNGVRNRRQVAKKASRQLFIKKFSCKAPVYHNCRIYANDGRLLCYCDRRKLEWYLRRDLAKLVDEDPPAIMLLFEPKGRPEDEDNDFYIQSKKNICVGCGEGNHYLRYRVIPSCYRIHFPEHLKSHCSHDIVLLCVDCHETAHAAAEKYKRQISIEFGIPLFVQKVMHSNQTIGMPDSTDSVGNVDEPGVSPIQLRAAAKALLLHGPEMPSTRHEELTQIVMRYYGGREISKEDLERALEVGMTPQEKRRLGKKKGGSLKHQENGVVDVSCRGDEQKGETLSKTGDSGLDMVTDSDLVGDGAIYTTSNHSSKLSLLGHGPHGKQVVDYLLSRYGEEGISQFCQRWRQVFVESVHPRFLPGGWDVMHSGRREFGEFSVYNPTKKVDDDSAISSTEAAAGCESEAETETAVVLGILRFNCSYMVTRFNCKLSICSMIPYPSILLLS